MTSCEATSAYYTIPRNNRELQQSYCKRSQKWYYTIPRNNRELQRSRRVFNLLIYYTIPRNNRELQPPEAVLVEFTIIPYQEIIGNYSRLAVFRPEL